jgi:hypothetical protein
MSKFNFLFMLVWVGLLMMQVKASDRRDINKIDDGKETNNPTVNTEMEENIVLDEKVKKNEEETNHQIVKESTIIMEMTEDIILNEKEQEDEGTNYLPVEYSMNNKDLAEKISLVDEEFIVYVRKNLLIKNSDELPIQSAFQINQWFQIYECWMVKFITKKNSPYIS